VVSSVRASRLPSFWVQVNLSSVLITSRVYPVQSSSTNVSHYVPLSCVLNLDYRVIAGHKFHLLLDTVPPCLARMSRPSLFRLPASLYDAWTKQHCHYIHNRPNCRSRWLLSFTLTSVFRWSLKLDLSICTRRSLVLSTVLKWSFRLTSRMYAGLIS